MDFDLNSKSILKIVGDYKIINTSGISITHDKKDDVLKDIETLKRICSMKSNLLKLRNKWVSSKSQLSQGKSSFITTIPKNKLVPSKLEDNDDKVFSLIDNENLKKKYKKISCI